MNIIPIPAFTDNYIWMLIDSDKKTAICVDPGEAKPVIDYLEKNNLSLKSILLTHHHMDHIGGTAELLNYDQKIAIYGPDDSRIPTLTHPVSEPSLVNLPNLQFNVLNIPGHTSSHICFYEPNLNLLFCGDTLFSAGCGRVFDGTLELLHASLAKLAALPVETRVYCGHEYTRQNLRFAASVEPGNHEIQNYSHELANDPTRCSLPSTIGLEKQINPFFRTQESSVKHYAQSRGCAKLDSLTIFKQLREDKNNF